jgi:biopolymer transport protein ExbD
MGVQLDEGGGKGGVKPNINVTPLVDVVLVLLIIFMVVIPNMQDHKAIDLFDTKKGEVDPEKEENAAVVTIAIDGTYHLGEDEVSREELLNGLAEIKASEPDRAILFRGDSRLEYGVIREIFYEAKERGHTNILLAVGKAKESDLGVGSLMKKTEE